MVTWCDMVFFWVRQTEASSPLPLCFLPFWQKKIRPCWHCDIVTLLWLRHGSHLDTLRPCPLDLPVLALVNCLKTSVGALSWKVPENLPKCLHLKSKFGGPVYTWTSGNVSFKLKGCSCDKKTRGIGHVGPVGPLLKAHQLVCFEFWKQNHQDFYTTYQLRTSRTSQANPSGKASLKICHRDTAPQVAGMTNLVKLYSKITDQLS